MDFDEDDPLGDLLSDNSNDSFFNDDKKVTAEPKKNLPSSDHLVKMKSELFGLTPERKPYEDTIFPNEKPAPLIKPNSPKITKTSNVRSQQVETKVNPINMKSNNDNLSFLDDVDIDLSKIEIKNKPKIPMLNKPSTENLINDSILNKTSSSSYTPSASMKPNVSIMTTEIKPSVQISSEKPRRSRNNPDWLGIFNDDVDELGMETKPLDSKKPIINESKQESDVDLKAPENTKSVNPDLFSVNKLELNNSNDANLEQASTSIFLQQQESQIALALQLKAQEEHLANLNEKQVETQKIKTELENARRNHMNNIMKEQAKQREQLQNAISQQHERINVQIEQLLKPTKSLKESHLNENKESVEFLEKSNENKLIDDKQYFSNIIEKLKIYHEKEKDAIEYSLRSQYHHLEEYLASMEMRFKDEVDKLLQYYQKKINQIEDDHNVEISKLLKDREDAEERHKNDIKIIQDQHKLVLENLRDNYMLEQNVIKNTTPHLQTLKDILKNIEEANNQCNILVQTVKLDKEEMTNEDHKKLLSKEKEISCLLDNLEYQRKNFEAETQKTNSVYELFEERYKQQITAVEDEKNILKKQRSELENDKYQVELELAKCKQSLEMKSENLKDKEQALKSLENDIKQQLISLQQEKDNLKKETSDLNNMKITIMNVKEKYEQKFEELSRSEAKLTNDRFKFENEESKILLKMNELETLTRATLAKQKISDGKMEEAKYLQVKYEEKLKRLQEYELSLSKREKQIAKEKIVLSQERLLLYNDRRENAICSLCKNSNENFKMNNELNSHFNNTFNNIQKLQNTNLKNSLNIPDIESKHNENLNMENWNLDAVEKPKQNIENEEIFNILSKYSIFKATDL